MKKPIIIILIFILSGIKHDYISIDINKSIYIETPSEVISVITSAENNPNEDNFSNSRESIENSHPIFNDSKNEQFSLIENFLLKSFSYGQIINNKFGLNCSIIKSVLTAQILNFAQSCVPIFITGCKLKL